MLPVLNRILWLTVSSIFCDMVCLLHIRRDVLFQCAGSGCVSCWASFRPVGTGVPWTHPLTPDSNYHRASNEWLEKVSLTNPVLQRPPPLSALHCLPQTLTWLMESDHCIWQDQLAAWWATCLGNALGIITWALPCFLLPWLNQNR